MFWFKKKQVVLDCFTSVPYIFEFAKPDYSMKFMPEWWKKTPLSYIDDGDFTKSPTMKRCSGFIENFKHGFMIPLWSDLTLELGEIGTPNYRWQYSDRMSDIETHNFKQLNDHISRLNILHAKLITHWSFKCNEDVMWLWSTPTWNMLGINDFITLPGTVDYKNQHATNINMLFYRSATPKIIELKFKSPLAQITPLTDRRLKLKHHLVDDREMKMLYDRTKNITFINKYSTIKNFRKGSK